MLDGCVTAFKGGKSGLNRAPKPDNVRRGKPQGKCNRKYTAY